MEYVNNDRVYRTQRGAEKVILIDTLGHFVNGNEIRKKSCNIVLNQSAIVSLDPNASTQAPFIYHQTLNERSILWHGVREQ
jgi:hypothetical protein